MQWHQLFHFQLHFTLFEIGGRNKTIYQFITSSGVTDLTVFKNRHLPSPRITMPAPPQTVWGPGRLCFVLKHRVSCLETRNHPNYSTLKRIPEPPDYRVSAAAATFKPSSRCSPIINDANSLNIWRHSEGAGCRTHYYLRGQRDNLWRRLEYQTGPRARSC